MGVTYVTDDLLEVLKPAIDALISERVDRSVSGIVARVDALEKAFAAL